MSPTWFKQSSPTRILIALVLTLQISSCAQNAKENSDRDTTGNDANTQLVHSNQSTTFPQIHTNLNGMVREFVRTMYQDKKGNFWFGTNGNGIIRYDGKTLETIAIEGIHPYERILEIVEDKEGNVWFASSAGLIKYNGEKFEAFSFQQGLPGSNAEIWGLTIDSSGRIWVGSVDGISQFDGTAFTPFLLPTEKVEDSAPMLSDNLVFKFLEDRHGTMWFATDGNGIFTFKDGAFRHITTKNGLSDNNVMDIFEDRQGNIWIGTFNGGVSKYDGTSFTNFTKDGIIEGTEAGGFYEDSKGNIWFAAENIGVYTYDGTTFTLYTTQDGLTANVVLSIFEDNKGQLWFGTWQGLCIFDGGKFVNARDKEPWTN